MKPAIVLAVVFQEQRPEPIAFSIEKHFGPNAPIWTCRASYERLDGERRWARQSVAHRQESLRGRAQMWARASGNVMKRFFLQAPMRRRFQEEELCASVRLGKRQWRTPTLGRLGGARAGPAAVCQKTGKLLRTLPRSRPRR